MAETFFKKKDYKQAEMHYRQVRAAAPKNFDGLHLSGLVAYQLARLPEAVDLLGRAHRIDRKHAVCAMRYGLALLAARKTAEAETALRLAVELKPDFHEGWDNLAYCLKTQDRLAEAVDCHRRCTGLRADYAIGWFNFGLTLSLLGRNTEALACHERSLQADPTYAQGRLGRAQVLHKTHRMAEAVADYRKFLDLQPGNLEARSHLLLALHNLADFSRDELLAEHRSYGRLAVAARTGCPR
jgi:tetratricopeptide (TPR) repeat protein